jgi:HEPN domain-containing protein
MPPDPERVAETRSWLGKAAEDLRAAEFELEADPPLFGDVLFHAQQAFEKVMKAHLVWYDVRFRKTHDLSELGRQCASVDASLGPLCHEAIGLTVYAWIYRYPGTPSRRLETTRWKPCGSPGTCSKEW